MATPTSVSSHPIAATTHDKKIIPMSKLHGFWISDRLIPGLTATNKQKFQAHPTDVLLATLPKSGTTWTKALLFAIANRGRHPPRSPHHPLLTTNPHDCIFMVEYILNKFEPQADDVPSPRLLATHLPFSLLPDSFATSDCRVIYVYRDPKDTLVSGWHFWNASHKATNRPSISLNEVLELFCDGVTPFGPLWDHRLDYRRESLRRPGKVLFLNYEEMLEDPAGSVRRMAEFVGCPFSNEEEAAGEVEEIVRLCSLETLRSAEVNKAGERSHLPIKNSTFFRKGTAGDWVNHMTPEMAQRIDEIVEHRLSGYEAMI